MKKVLNCILVVEGKSDVSYLSSYYDAEYVITNGSEISLKTIEYLKKCAGTKEIVVLTDPDFPGKRIRDVLDSHIPNLKHCFIHKEFAVKHGKVGVAECDIAEIERALSHLFVNKTNINNSINVSDLYRLKLCGDSNSSLLRQKVSDVLNLGFTNAKTFCKRLNSMNIELSELERIVNEQN